MICGPRGAQKRHKEGAVDRIGQLCRPELRHHQHLPERPCDRTKEEREHGVLSDAAQRRLPLLAGRRDDDDVAVLCLAVHGPRCRLGRFRIEANAE